LPVEASSSARRVVAVLTYLAGCDEERSLTEIAVATDMNKTTCQSVLLALTDSGYVQRDDARKTYRLGPAVLALTTSIGAPQEALHALASRLKRSRPTSTSRPPPRSPPTATS
jgi:DNA-binding IclR family transcriptional regulator